MIGRMLGRCVVPVAGGVVMVVEPVHGMIFPFVPVMMAYRMRMRILLLAMVAHYPVGYQGSKEDQQGNGGDYPELQHLFPW